MLSASFMDRGLQLRQVGRLLQVSARPREHTGTFEHPAGDMPEAHGEWGTSRTTSRYTGFFERHPWRKRIVMLGLVAGVARARMRR